MRWWRVMSERLRIGRLNVPDETRRRLHLEEDVRELQAQLAEALHTVQAQAREIRDLYERLAREQGSMS